MLTTALNRPPPDAGDTHFGHAPGQHRSLPSPNRRAGALPVPGPDRSSLGRPLIVLATGTFAIGTDAFVIGGVLPAVARSLGVSTSSAGLLVTAFAVAYALGAPILAVAGARLARRTLLVSALAVFVAANVLAAAAPSYALLLIARVLAALAAAAFVPTASAVASSLAPAEYRGRALATVVAGMTVAQVAGVPFGAFVGAWLGWRYTFIFVAALGAAAALAVRLWLPHVQPPAPASLGRRLSVAARPSTWPLLLQTTLAMAAGFSVLTYIGPLLSQAGHYHGAMISMALLVFGVASVAGSTLGGRAHRPLRCVSRGCRRSRGAHPGDAGGQRRHRSIGRLASTRRPRRMGSGRLDLPTFSAAPSDRDSTWRRKRGARPQQLRDIRRCCYRGRSRRPGTACRRRFRPRPRGRARRLRLHLRCGAAPLHATRDEISRRVQSHLAKSQTAPHARRRAPPTHAFLIG